MEKKYVIGIDFGTLSGRAILVDARNGRELCSAVYEYPHGVMERALPDGTPLPPLYALQDAQDYLGVLREAVPALLRDSGIQAEEIAGVGVDFTACTMLPIDAEGNPLSSHPEFRSRPHAYVKLWKHHSAGQEGAEMTALARSRGEKWLESCGGEVSCEWMFPKILEILRCDEEIFNRTARFIEAGDWISLVLTGQESHSAAYAGYKANWTPETGYPSNAFLTLLDARLDGLVGTRIASEVRALSEGAGVLHERGAAMTGLLPGTSLAVPVIDAHAAIPGAGMTRCGEVLAVVGTSVCMMFHSEEPVLIPGSSGMVREGVLEGLCTGEAGQAGCGDAFAWFVQNCVPPAYHQEAQARGIGLHQLLREKSIALRPGESGLLALDWLVGNRCVLNDPSLSGMLLGLRLDTRPEEIYRALIESVVFGGRMILDTIRESGVPVSSILAGGGIAAKDAMMMQIYADVTGLPVRVCGTLQAGAMGSAVYAAAAAGIYGSVREASEAMAPETLRLYEPIPENVRAYEALYEEYRLLHDYFGRGVNEVMHRMEQRKRSLRG